MFLVCNFAISTSKTDSCPRYYIETQLTEMHFDSHYTHWNSEHSEEFTGQQIKIRFYGIVFSDLVHGLNFNWFLNIAKVCVNTFCLKQTLDSVKQKEIREIRMRCHVPGSRGCLSH